MSMAAQYAMKKRARKMADGGEAMVDPEKAKMATQSMRKAFNYAEGGPVKGDQKAHACYEGCYLHGGLVDRIMDKRGSMPMADDESADYDYMDERSAGHEADYDGANSGDEDGNEAMEDEEDDMISRIMRSRAKKDRMPRPA